MTHPYRSAPLVAPRRKPPTLRLWHGLLNTLSAQRWYRRLVGGRWAQCPCRPPVRLDDGAVLIAELWGRTPRCPAEFRQFTAEEIARESDELTRAQMASQTWVAREHVERCTCEVWP